MANILILGGLGFLGKNLYQTLSKSNKIFIADCVDRGESNYFNIKLSDTDKLIQIIDENHIKIVIHLVSSIIPSSSIKLYLDDVREIYIPTVQLLDYCADKKIRFVYFSSGGAVYGNQKEIFNEHTKREPVSYYGLSKLNFENIITYFHNTKELEYLIIRPSNPYGYGQNIYGKQGIIAVIIGKILKNEKLQIWGDGSAVKDYIYIDDFVYYLNNLIENPNAWNQTFNIGSGSGTSLNDVLNAFRENNIILPEIEYIEENKSDVKRMILDCTKIQEMFPKTLTPVKTGIKLFWDKINND